MAAVNRANKAKRCRHRLLEYYRPGDTFATWTYQARARPDNMQEAIKDFQKAIRYVKREYAKRGRTLYWIRNIEKGTRGAWHIHIVVNEIGDTASILQKAWAKGGTYTEEIRLSDKLYDEDFTKLANYMTKDERTMEDRSDGSKAKPRISEASYSTSRNMPLKEPKVDKLTRWKSDPKPKKGYYIAKIYTGVNPATGFLYRRYTMLRVHKTKGKEMVT